MTLNFLELCDEYGLYVIDENNMETHGTGWSTIVGCPQLPASRPEWEKACMERIKATYNRDKNITSVVCWSLGNESLGGAVPKKCINILRMQIKQDLCILNVTVHLMKRNFRMCSQKCMLNLGIVRNMQ